MYDCVQDWKDHLEAQLDSLLGKLVCSTLRVLPGDQHRLQGGTPLEPTSHPTTP